MRNLGLALVIGCLLLVEAGPVFTNDQTALKRRDVEAVIDGRYAVDAPTYAEYQNCLGKISISDALDKVAAARQACKDAAIRKSYILPSGANERAPSSAQKRLEEDLQPVK